MPHWSARLSNKHTVRIGNISPKFKTWSPIGRKNKNGCGGLIPYPSYPAAGRFSVKLHALDRPARTEHRRSCPHTRPPCLIPRRTLAPHASNVFWNGVTLHTYRTGRVWERPASRMPLSNTAMRCSNSSGKGRKRGTRAENIFFLRCP